MGLYTKYILPKVIHWACGLGPTSQQRGKIIPRAQGDVLEIGIGSGLNLPHYSSDVRSVIGVDPYSELWKENTMAEYRLDFPVEVLQAWASEMPVEKHTIDTVVVTYSLCSIPELPPVFDEIRRVLRPDGQLLFCEHGKSPDNSVLTWQRRVGPLWGKFSGGCRLDRDIPRLIRENGFTIDRLDTMYIPGWKPASFNFWGSASAR